MSAPGAPDDDVLVHTRAALLDALDALHAHLDAIVVVGAQAVYLQTPSAPVAVAEYTRDSDLAVDPRNLAGEPLIERAMADAGFTLDLTKNQPGAWLNAAGIEVDLMVPEELAGPGGKRARSARIPPHGHRATRRARGLEAAMVDNATMTVPALARTDRRRRDVRVAGPGALLIAKTHKIAERAAGPPDRLIDKDAHDLYRILVHHGTEPLATTMRRLLEEPLCATVTREALVHLTELFAAGPDAIGATMAGRAEEGIGEPLTVSLQTSVLAGDLLEAIGA